MKTRNIAFVLITVLLVPGLLLLGQERTRPLTGPDGKPILGPDGKPATVTLSVENPPAAGPELSSLPPDKVVMSIGEEKLTAAELGRIIDVLPEQAKANARGPNRRQFAEDIVRLKLLAQEARKRKLDQTPAFQSQIAFQAENMLAGLLFQEMAKTAPVDEAAARAWYDQHKSEFETVQARHILVRMKGSPVPVKPEQKDLSEEEALAKAKEIRQKLEAGADFGDLARTESDDSGSGANGGDLGKFGRGQMTPTFEQAAFAMQAGQLSEPVRTPFGFHIIKVEAKNAPAFEEMRGEIEKRLRPEMARKALEEMRNAAEVTLDPAYFGEEKSADRQKQ